MNVKDRVKEEHDKMNFIDNYDLYLSTYTKFQFN